MLRDTIRRCNRAFSGPLYRVTLHRVTIHRVTLHRVTLLKKAGLKRLPRLLCFLGLLLLLHDVGELAHRERERWPARVVADLHDDLADLALGDAEMHGAQVVRMIAVGTRHRDVGGEGDELALPQGEA